MKMPAFDKDKAIALLIAHGDKAVIALLALFACGLAWGGIDALRSQGAGEQRLPKSILDTATRAAGHIDREKAPPAEVRVSPESLATRTKPWESPTLEVAKTPPLFDKPLFEELAKRTKPEILPIERLEATAGIAVLAVAAQANPQRVEPVPQDPQKPAGGKRPKKEPAGGPRGEGIPSPFGPGPFGEPMAPPPGPNPGFAPAVAANLPRGKIVPYVIVTGLIPYEKQQEEYRRRFMQASYRDPKRDEPIWSDYLVERAEIRADGRENWERIDLKAVAKKASELWAGVQSESLPGEFMLPGAGAAGRGPTAGTVSFSGYCLPLPQMASEGWGPKSIHSWFLETLQKTWSERAAPVAPQSPVAIDGPAFPDRPPDFGVPGAPGEGGFDPGVAPGGEGLLGQIGLDGREKRGPPYRLFRFVDTSVQIGRRYRYRVRLSVWNPNFKLPARYLTEAALATPDRLASPASEASPVVSVPQPVNVLVRSLRKADMKRFKPGMLEALVIGESGISGNYSLRSVITEAGGLANVDAKLNKPGDTRVRGEDIRTDRLIVDVRGRQQDREEERSGGRPTPPPEPLELLVLRPDGQFEVVSLADSQSTIDSNASTLPVIELAPKPPAMERGPGGPAPPGGVPF